MKVIRCILIIIIFYRIGLITGQTTEYHFKPGNQETAEYDFSPCQQELNDTTLYTIVDSMPEFPGGEDSLYIYIKENLKYPKGRATYEGAVMVYFVVETDGQLTGIQFGETTIIAKDAVRIAESLIKKMPKWETGKCNGRKVRVVYSIPVPFYRE
jgi:protein TonB